MHGQLSLELNMDLMDHGVCGVLIAPIRSKGIVHKEGIIATGRKCVV